MSETSVRIIVPIHRSVLSDCEIRTLRHNVRTLGAARFILLLPERLAKLPALLDTEPFSGIVQMRVSDEWLGPKNGILGYNRMMMAETFYAHFIDEGADYLLICQPDAWIFRDELDAWCAKGYDYIGGPYLRQSIYDLPPIKQWLTLRRACCDRSRVLRQDGWGKVLNGGLSLRRIEAFRQACAHHADLIEQLGQVRSTVSNEDWFWSLVPDLRRPEAEEAARFSIDTHPARTMKSIGGVLPFGCHGWFKRKRLRFWEPYILESEQDGRN